LIPKTAKRLPQSTHVCQHKKIRENVGFNKAATIIKKRFHSLSMDGIH
jgi:hypothetical protein